MSAVVGARRLAPFLSPVGVWAYGVGCAIGWGSLVVTSNQYLLQGGPLGSVLGIIAGSLVMVVIARNYAYMMNRYPDSGGSYTYARHVLGYDYGFLMGWFLVLAYIAVFWANATSLPLFSRFFLGGVFKVGYLYTLFGYDVYIGEALLTMIAIGLAGLLCTRDKRVKQAIMVALAFTFCAAIVICASATVFLEGNSGGTMDPLFIPDQGAVSQIFAVSLMTPWAFIGFESISNSTEEFAFPRTKSFRIFMAVIVTTALLYALVCVMSITAYPDRYDSWFAYFNDLGNLEGIEGLPPFYAAQYYLGDAGLVLMMLALLALVISSLIGMLVALSRLFVALARDGLVAEKLSELNDKGTPQRAILLITGVSLLVPFLGRTPIGWIVDITTISAIIVYSIVSIAEYRIGRTEADKGKMATGGIGFAVMVVFGLVTLVPSLLAQDSLEPETYLLLTVWSVLGFLYFRRILRNDERAEFGKSVIVWVFLLALVLFSSTVWTQKSDQNLTNNAFMSLQEHLEHYDDVDLAAEEQFISEKIDELAQAEIISSLITMSLLALAIAMMMSNNSFMRKREEERERELGVMRDAAYRDSLTGVKSKNAYIAWEREADFQVARGQAEELVIIVCDVNGLKYINDTLGHQAGDEYIKQACKMICEYFKRSPVFRIGGDEFVVIPQGDDLANYQQILTEFDREIELNIAEGKAVVSAGYSIFRPGLDTRFHDVFERADARMYQRKMQLKGMGAATRD